MNDSQFQALCNTYGFAPSWALRELIDCATARAEAAQRERIIAQNAPEIEKINAYIKALEEASEAFGKRQEWWNERMFVLEQQRDALLEALKNALNVLDATGASDEANAARAAIKKVEGENT